MIYVNYFTNLSVYIVSNGMKTGESLIGNDVEGSGCDLIEALSRQFPGVTEENYETPQS